MQVSARVDYALRALLVLAASPMERMTRDELAAAQSIPPRYLEDIMTVLRHAGFVATQRGQAGGYRLGRRPEAIVVADVARAVDGPLALVQGERPEAVQYSPPCEHLGELWIGLRAAMRSVLEQVTLSDLLSGQLPDNVRAFLDDPEAWRPH